MRSELSQSRPTCDPLAERILLGDILDGSIVKITAGSDRLNFHPIRGALEDEGQKIDENA